MVGIIPIFLDQTNSQKKAESVNVNFFDQKFPKDFPKSTPKFLFKK